MWKVFRYKKNILNYWGENMNLSELAGKEIVNLISGERLGVIGEWDIIIDETTGNVYDINITVKESKIINGSKIILI